MTAIALDIRTLLVVTILMTGLTGGLLIVTWLQNRGERAPMLWGVGCLSCGLGAALVAVRDAVPAVVATGAGNALIIFGYALLWAGARCFDGRRLPLAGVVAGPLAWFAAVPAIGEDIGVRLAVGSLIGAGYFGLAARELWRGRAERLSSRLPVAGLLAVHTVALVGRAALQIVAPPSSLAAAGPLTAASLLEGALVLIAGSFLLLMMAKERAEAEARYAAGHDVLTGLVNRRAFLVVAEEVRAACVAAGAPLSLAVIDLDHFKAVNDRHGHPAGDRALQVFAATTLRLLGPGDVLARFGGDEFALLLPGAGAAAAAGLADRVRQAAVAAIDADPQIGGAVTLSAGVASLPPAASLPELLATADRALYDAKAEGRNRVVRAPAD